MAHFLRDNRLSPCSPLPAAYGAPPTLPRPGDYYVDAVGGSDLNAGTASAPWRTIQKAADTVLAGSTVHVRPGRYQERVRITRPGRSGAPIVYQAEGVARTRGFTILADDITVRNFEITGTEDLWDDGVGIFVNARRCRLENNQIRHATRGGILLFGEPGEAGSADCVVRNNRLYRSALVGIEGERLWPFAVAGVLLSLAYLTRPEALITCALLTTYLVVLWLAQRRLFESTPHGDLTPLITAFLRAPDLKSASCLLRYSALRPASLGLAAAMLLPSAEWQPAQT